ncbi:protein containing PilT protein, N-terminal domain [sediment metagenome]|uniref:Protein containing PilT protein, N-terminal domain n=1 Tax=sediment metagenome TaxID=749907 RepID=D9PHD6_9ZZZZ
MSGSKKILLDTNAIINALNKNLVLPENRFIISIITEMELLSFPKITKIEEQTIKTLLKNFEIINIVNEIKELTIELRKQYGLKMPDSIICATAQINNATLISDDKQLAKVDLLEVIGLDEFIKS